RAELAAEHDISTLGAQSNFHCIRQCVYPAHHCPARCFAVNEIFPCHLLFPPYCPTVGTLMKRVPNHIESSGAVQGKGMQDDYKGRLGLMIVRHIQDAGVLSRPSPSAG